MKFVLLGSGTPAPSLTRMSSGYALEIGDDLIVFDHGGGAHHRFLEAGFRAKDVTHCFLTHYHYDHIMDLPRLALTRWDHGGPDLPALKIYGPAPLQLTLDRFFGPDGAFALDISARIDSPASQAVYEVRGGEGARRGPEFNPTEVSAGDTIEGKTWKITVGPTRHVQPTLNCIAYRIETDEGTIVYSGDNGGVFEPFIEFARGSDVLVHMNHFLSGTELNPDYRVMSGSHMDNAETARQADVGMLVLTHLQPDLDAFGIGERMVTEMSDIFKGPIVIGHDLMEIPMQVAMHTVAD